MVLVCLGMSHFLALKVPVNSIVLVTPGRLPIPAPCVLCIFLTASHFLFFSLLYSLPLDDLKMV